MSTLWNRLLGKAPPTYHVHCVLAPTTDGDYRCLSCQAGITRQEAMTMRWPCPLETGSNQSPAPSTIHAIESSRGTSTPDASSTGDGEP